MPAKIRMETVWRVIAGMVDPSRDVINIKKADFEDLVLGAGIASSKQTIKALWAQARFSGFNIYAGAQPDKVIILDMKALRETVEPAKKGVYTYTHTRNTNTQEVA